MGHCTYGGLVDDVANHRIDLLMVYVCASFEGTRENHIIDILDVLGVLCVAHSAYVSVDFMG
jgi:hypothetical protein